MTAMYRIRILEAATRELARLDKPVGRRIVERLNWLAANFETVTPEPLTRELSGPYKFRVGDYRILYEIPHDEQSLVIHAIGHRRDIYRRRMGVERLTSRAQVVQRVPVADPDRLCLPGHSLKRTHVGSHPQLLGQGEGLSVVTFGLLDV